MTEIRTVHRIETREALDRLLDADSVDTTGSADGLDIAAANPVRGASRSVRSVLERERTLRSRAGEDVEVAHGDGRVARRARSHRLSRGWSRCPRRAPRRRGAKPVSEPGLRARRPLARRLRPYCLLQAGSGSAARRAGSRLAPRDLEPGVRAPLVDSVAASDRPLQRLQPAAGDRRLTGAPAADIRNHRERTGGARRLRRPAGHGNGSLLAAGAGASGR